MADMSGAESDAGARIVHLDVMGTAVFALTAGLSAALFTGVVKVVAVVVALVLFSIGVVTFLWSYWTAVQRSRTENIAVAQLYFLASASAPRNVRLTMNLVLVGQVMIGLGTALVRNSTDGRAGSTLAFGILVPMFGLGLNGLWCSKFGKFSTRQPASPKNRPGINSTSVPPTTDEMEQNSTHG